MASDPVVFAASAQLDLVLTDTCIAGDGIGFDGTNWIRSDADATTPIGIQFFALHKCATSGDTIKVARKVVLYDADAPYTKGALQFASGTAGKITETNPIAAGAAVQCVGVALTTDTVDLDADLVHTVIPLQLPGTLPQTSTNYPACMVIADRPMRLIAARASHAVASSSGTVDVYKAASGTAIGSGATMLTGTMSTAGTADTPVAGTPSATAANARLKPGDQCGLVAAGTLTSGTNLRVTLTFVQDI